MITQSLVIPARNAATTLPRTLAALGSPPLGWEIVVVDDHSTDDTARIAKQAGARVVPSFGRRSDGAARNTGAQQTTGEYIVFLDADVEVTFDVITRAVTRVASEALAALFAVYDRGAHLPNVASRYKNFWIRWTTLAAPRPLDWLNTSCAVIRRDVWEQVGGFIESYSAATGGGTDIEFGQRVHQRGVIELDPGFEVRHNKRFTLATLLRNDYRRARDWCGIALQRHGWRRTATRTGFANVSRRFSFSAGAAGLALGLLLVTPWFPLLLISVAALLAIPQVVHGSFLRAAARERVSGWCWFPLLIWADGLACCLGIAHALLRVMVSRLGSAEQSAPVPPA